MNPIALKLLMFEKLEESGVIQNLQTLMTEEEIVTLCGTGVLTISKGSHLITAQGFPNPLLPNLEGVLTKAGFIENEITILAKDIRFVTQINDSIVRLYDEVFDKGNSGQSIVIDLVRDPDGSAKECLDYFQTRAQQYVEENPSETNSMECERDGRQGPDLRRHAFQLRKPRMQRSFRPKVIDAKKNPMQPAPDHEGPARAVP